MKRHPTEANTFYGKHLTEIGLQFRGLAHYHIGGKYDSTQADMVQKWKPGVLYSDMQEERNRHWVWLELLKPQSAPPHDTLIKLVYIHYNKAHLLIVSLAMRL